jgi:hypothetical protein
MIFGVSREEEEDGPALQEEEEDFSARGGRIDEAPTRSRRFLIDGGFRGFEGGRRGRIKEAPKGT